MRIIGPPSAARATVSANLAKQTGVHPRFAADMFPALWDAGLIIGIDPVGVVAQAFKETGGGTFKGRVRPEFYNPCGLKSRVSLFPGVDDDDQPLAHARFASWRVGALAHVQHLAAYAGLPIEGLLIVDPRYELVTGKAIETFEELGGPGSWAPSPSYGAELVAIARRLQVLT